MFPQVSLQLVTRQDISNMGQWLNDPEVNASWYGANSDGLPLHIGYSPYDVLDLPDDEWQQVFANDDRRIYSIYTGEYGHIGEGQLAIEWPLSEAQLFLIVGRKDLWHHHYGTMAMIRLLDDAFETCGLHRVWVDVPEYNEHALQLCRHIGFVLEGHLRGTHHKEGQWYDSFAMGLLIDEYSRRRTRLLGPATV